MAKVSFINAVNIDTARIVLAKRVRADGVVLGYVVELVEFGRAQTLFQGISDLSARMWFKRFQNMIQEGWRPA